MSKAISGIKAAWLEHDGLGTLTVCGKTLVFKDLGGYTVRWPCRTAADAERQMKLFRAATKYPQTKEA